MEPRKEVTELELNILFKQLKELHIDDVKHSTLEIRNYKIIVREMELGKRSGYIPMLKFPQLTICYHFDYTKYLTGKKIFYSVLTSTKTKIGNSSLSNIIGQKR